MFSHGCHYPTSHVACDELCVIAKGCDIQKSKVVSKYRSCYNFAGRLSRACTCNTIITNALLGGATCEADGRAGERTCGPTWGG